MSEAYLPVAVLDKYRGRWSERGHLRWLGWLLQFQSLDLARLTLKQQRGLCNNIITFCYSYPFALPDKAGIIRAERVERLSISAVRPKVKSIQKRLREGIQSLIVGEKTVLADPKGILPKEFKDSPDWDTVITRLWQLPIKTLSLNLWRLPEYKSSRGDKPRRFKSGAVEYFLQSGWPDIFWLAVADFLRIYGDRIRQCQKVDCRKTFIRTKRQDYCSAECSQSARSKKWYVTNQAKATRNRRVKYEEKMKMQCGPNIQIRRRVER